MWQNICLSLSCKTPFSYNAIYFPKVSWSARSSAMCWSSLGIFNEQCISAEMPLPSKLLPVLKAEREHVGEPLINMLFVQRKAKVDLVFEELWICAIQIALWVVGIRVSVLPHWWASKLVGHHWWASELVGHQWWVVGIWVGVLLVGIPVNGKERKRG